MKLTLMTYGRGLMFGWALFVAATAPVQAGTTYQFDKGHTQIRFSWNHLGLSTQSAGFVEFDGQVELDEGNIPASAVSVKIGSASLQTGNTEFDGHLKSDEFFDVAKHPEISFASNKVVQTGPESAQIIGDLTIKGVTRPVTLDAKLNFLGKHPSKGHQAAGFFATTRVLRSAFDLGAYAPAVSDAVDITISTELKASGS